MIKEPPFVLLPSKTYPLASGVYTATVVYACLRLRWSQQTKGAYTALDVLFETKTGGQARLYTWKKEQWPKAFAALGDSAKWVSPVPPRRLRALMDTTATISVYNDGKYANVKAINGQVF